MNLYFLRKPLNPQNKCVGVCVHGDRMSTIRI